MWKEIDFERREIDHVTRKRKRRVVLPIQSELLALLEMEYSRRNPTPDDFTLLNPENGRPLSRKRLYQQMLALGRRAGVLQANPHRFRDTFAVDMLARGASPRDVAKLLGDTIETVEQHYVPYVRELRERSRTFMENSQGLEAFSAPKQLPQPGELLARA